jgi:hypothetical protein
MHTFYGECDHFVSLLSPYLTISFDESNWHLVMADDQAVAVRGAETVCHPCEGDAKANFSFFAKITADGSRLPLILVTKGKTDRCHKQLGSHDSYIYDASHSSSGWSIVPLMTQYLKWLRAQIPEDTLCLITDQDMTHAAPETEEEAEELRIKIV